MAGVVCTHCGASTPLPDDLRAPTFACQFCHTALSTEAYAGTGAVRVAEMSGYLDGILEDPGAIGQAPKLVHGDGGTREAPCVHCGAPLAIPLTITEPTVHCASCGKTEFVNRYVSDGERLKLDMGRQVAGNQAVQALVESGVRCPNCGAQNAVAQPVSVQITCASCRHVILLSDFVAADAIDRARLKKTLYEFRDDLRAKQEERRRLERYIALGAFVVVGIAILIAVWLTNS